MSDNVFILGAGFSKDANIPLLGDFIERMLDYAYRLKTHERNLTPDESVRLGRAREIIHDLDGYHGRVRFDDSNIEDIMSMLAFDVLAGGEKSDQKLNHFTRAIADTIELACRVKHPGYDCSPGEHREGSHNYYNFWKALISSLKDDIRLPTIISLNYDFVLERSLLQILQSRGYNKFPSLGINALTLDYNYPHVDPIHFRILNDTPHDKWWKFEVVEENQIPDGRNTKIEILKLHGSLNFPRKKSNEFPANIVRTQKDPNIVPPVSNKQSDKSLSGVWKRALNALRVAKRVIFVGYSLPKTDMYMQFFLKAALGPNKDLRKVIVYNPKLFDESCQQNQLMRERYRLCFAEQMEKHIEFNPINYKYPNLPPDTNSGTFRHLVDNLEYNSKSVLY